MEHASTTVLTVETTPTLPTLASTVQAFQSPIQLTQVV
jgi:hypothetical protein